MMEMLQTRLEYAMRLGSLGLLFTLAISREGSAQEVHPLGAVRQAQAAHSQSSSQMPARNGTQNSTSSVGRGLWIGTLVGAAAGALVALVVEASSSGPVRAGRTRAERLSLS
jgi:hypothetical protein